MWKLLTKRVVLASGAALTGVASLATTAVVYVNRQPAAPAPAAVVAAAVPGNAAEQADGSTDRPEAEKARPSADPFAGKRRYDLAEAAPAEPTVRSQSNDQDGFPSADQAFAGDGGEGVNPAAYAGDAEDEPASGRLDPLASGRYAQRDTPDDAAGDDDGAGPPQEFAPGPATRLEPEAGGETAYDNAAFDERFGAEPASGDSRLPSNAADPYGAAAGPSDEGDSALGAGRPGEPQLDGPQSPTVTVEKTAPPEIQIGKAARFEIRVKNDGNVAAHEVEVHDEVPQGTELISTTPQAELAQGGTLVWALGTIRPGEERTLAVELTPTEEGEIGSVARVYFAAIASARTRATRPQLEVQVEAPQQVLIGEAVAVAIHVSNPGSGAATGVIIEAALPEGLQHEAGPELEYELGDLQPGESRDLNLTLTAAKAGRAASLLVARGDGNLAAEKQAEIDILAAELEVGLAGSKRRYLEREATYAVSVSNPGTAPAREIELTLYLPEGMEFVKADNYGEYDPSTRGIRWSLEELPPGETGEVTMVALPTIAGEQQLLIEGAAAQGLAARQEQMISVEGVAAILFEVVDVADPIEVGTETSYEIRVVNQGSKAASDVRVVVLLPDELEFVEATAPVGHALENQQLIFDSLPQLAPKADTTYQVKVRGLAPGDQRINVQLLTGDMQAPVTKEESTHVLPNE